MLEPRACSAAAVVKLVPAGICDCCTATISPGRDDATVEENDDIGSWKIAYPIGGFVDVTRP